MGMTPRTKTEYLRELVAEKNRWNRPLTAGEKALGFLGWHQRGYLPHCDYPGLIQFITFRLADSMPISRRGEWEKLLSIENDRERRKKLEEYLDRGLGECHLGNPCIAQLATAALLHFHGERYELMAWCVMSNHIHALVQVWQTPVGAMVRSWKRSISTQAETASMERRSPTRRVPAAASNPPARRAVAAAQQVRWQRDYWDTFMRDEGQERTAIRYIESNPMKVRLCKSPEDWLFSSARFRDKYQRLAIMRQCNGNQRGFA
jgi:putative transposase